MSLLDALLLEPAPFDIYISSRTDSRGSGTINDPYWGGDEDKFDDIMNSLASRKHICINVGEGEFRTSGYADGVTGACWLLYERLGSL